jgi:preprotein translocase subunit SecA
MSQTNLVSSAESTGVSSGGATVRNRIGWRQRLARFQGSSIDFDLRSFNAPLADINAREAELANLSDHEIDSRAIDLRSRARAGDDFIDITISFFALAREIARRTIGQRPFDVQIVAALAMHRGAVVEMQTGEGKTLAAVMPAALNALTGTGVHVLTFNDYLARRDANSMGPIYNRLGLSVAFVHGGMTTAERRRAYGADVTYVTAKEAGFDYLRDLLAMDVSDLVHRSFHFALVDEADSLLIDEARVPLVIAGTVEADASSSHRLAELVATLAPGIDFAFDEYARDVELTDQGIVRVEAALRCGSLYDDRNYQLLTELNCALHARALLKRDVDYLVRDGRIGMIDELTGRVVPYRHWPDGLQAAIEAKEGLERRPDGHILGSITLQHFLANYRRLCGMTGTAQDAASELHEFYGRRVVVIPTHRPMIRIDRPDVIFTHREAKERAAIEEIKRVHTLGRPVLVGTLTVEESERLARRLAHEGVNCAVLNAKNDEAEAQIVARAGEPGAVTISTNMAGRGTDICLGGTSDATPGDLEAKHARVVALGGLYVIGTNRHESRRVDLQLMGRAGRQGDPGESCLFVSLEDDLLVRYGIQCLIGGRFMPDTRDALIDSPVVTREIARAQRIVEGQNLEIRRTLWKYAMVVEEQRRITVERRQVILTGREVPDVWHRAADKRARLVAAAGEDAVRRAERLVTLNEIDRAWRDHLSLIADVREGIHLVALGGQDPFAQFTRDVTMAFHRLQETVEERILAALDSVRADGSELDLSRLRLKGPSATWTYLVNDDPFRNQIGMMLTGPGRATFAIGAALVSMPLLILWNVVDRLFRRRRARRRNPAGE